MWDGLEQKPRQPLLSKNFQSGNGLSRVSKPSQVSSVVKRGAETNDQTPNCRKTIHPEEGVSKVPGHFINLAFHQKLDHGLFSHHLAQLGSHAFYLLKRLLVDEKTEHQDSGVQALFAICH